jgi:hypothetical protein
MRFNATVIAHARVLLAVDGQIAVVAADLDQTRRRPTMVPSASA